MSHQLLGLHPSQFLFAHRFFVAYFKFPPNGKETRRSFVALINNSRAVHVSLFQSNYRQFPTKVIACDKSRKSMISHPNSNSNSAAPTMDCIERRSNERFTPPPIVIICCVTIAKNQHKTKTPTGVFLVLRATLPTKLLALEPTCRKANVTLHKSLYFLTWTN